MKLSNPSSPSGRKQSLTRTLEPELISLLRLVDEGRHLDVETAARRYLARRPNHPLALKALSVSLIGQGRGDEALPMLEYAVRHWPHDAEMHNNLGIVLSFLLRWDEALACFNKAIALTPTDFELHKNLGAAYVRMHRWNDAVPPLLKAIELHPEDYVEAIFLLAGALLNAKRGDEAWTCYEQLWESDRENPVALYLLLSASLNRGDWTDLQQRIALLRSTSAGFSKHLDAPFFALGLSGVTGDEQLRIAQAHATQVVPKTLLEESVELPRTQVSMEGARRLRIGYLSADFREHPVGYIFPQVVEAHDRERVEVFGYSIGVNDGSAIRRRLEQVFDKFVELRDSPVRETMARIRADQIDILVDLQGWTADARPEALALRCAPVQVNWLGYAGTMGHARFADYVIGDPTVTPVEHAAWYTEAIAQMPHCYLPVDATRSVPSAPSRAAAGLPDSGFVFGSHNPCSKFNPEIFDVWCRLLASADGSCLWLSKPGETAQRLLREEAAKRGIDPERIIFAPRVEAFDDHLARLQLIDLALDPSPYNSHSSGMHVLWAGVPMVSYLGNTFPSRVGASLLRAAGLSELVTHSLDEYFDLALDLQRNPARLSQMRRHLQDNRATLPLFDMPSFCRSLERLYARMWENHVAGKRESIT